MGRRLAVINGDEAAAQTAALSVGRGTSGITSPMSHGQPLSIHEGNHGEHHVAWRLSRHAIVRSPGQGEDTGIDLYCEGVDTRTTTSTLRLLNLFLVQVKTTASEKENAAAARRSPALEVKHLRYWLEQPLPVYVFHVALPTKWLEDPAPEPTIVAYDVAWWWARLDQGARTRISGRKTATIPRGRPWTVEFHAGARGDEAGDHTRHSFGSFVESHVACSHAVVAGRRGFVRFIPDRRGPTLVADLDRQLCLARLGLTASLLRPTGEELTRAAGADYWPTLLIADGAIVAPDAPSNSTRSRRRKKTDPRARGHSRTSGSVTKKSTRSRKR